MLQRMGDDEVTCADLGDEFPSVEDFNNALGGGAVALYVVCAIVIIVLAVQFGFLSRHILRHVPDSRKVQICRKICGLGCVTRALVHA